MYLPLELLKRKLVLRSEWKFLGYDPFHFTTNFDIIYRWIENFYGDQFDFNTELEIYSGDI